MTNESARELTIPLHFLGKGKYSAEIWQDGKTISSVDKATAELNARDKLTLKLAATGGAVVVLKK